VETEIVQVTEEARLKMAALSHVIDLHNELHPGKRRAAARHLKPCRRFHFGRPGLWRALADRAADADIDEMTTVLRWPLQDALYHRVRSYLEYITGPPVFTTAEQLSR
jgi:hypothetical protein